MLALGQLCARLRCLPPNTALVLNAFVLNVCLPALVLSAIPQLDLNVALLALVLIAWLVMVACAVCVRLLSTAMTFDRETEGCLMLVCVLGNTAFIGYPLIRAWLGEPAMPYAVVYDQLGSFIALPILGAIVVARYTKQGGVTLREISLKVLRFPAFIALLLAFLPITQPAPLSAVVKEVAGLLVPLAMFAIGLKLRFTPAPGQTLPLVLGLGIKMLVAPLVAYGLASALLTHEVRSVAVLQAAMPPMVSAAALAASAGLSPRLSAAMAGYGILLALAWIPLLASLT